MLLSVPLSTLQLVKPIASFFLCSFICSPTNLYYHVSGITIGPDKLGTPHGVHILLGETNVQPMGR